MKTFKELQKELNEVSVLFRTATGALNGALTMGGFVAPSSNPYLIAGTALVGAGIGGLWARKTAIKANAAQTDPKFSPGTVYRGHDGEDAAMYQILKHYPSTGKTDIKHLGTGEKMKIDSDELPDIQNPLKE